jgi:hypothetical protein
MRDLSFRPRPLDVNRPIPVIRKEIEFDISRSVPELPNGMEEEDIPLMGMDVDIPTPVVKVVEGWDTEVDLYPLNRTQTYIRYEGALQFASTL